MARIIFIVPPLTGHINPTVAVGQELIERGHEVSWLGHPEIIRRSLPLEYEVYPLGEGISPTTLGALHSGRDQRGLAAFQFLWEGVLIPLAKESYHEVYTHLAQLQPDLCIVDQQTLAGAIACRQLNLPWMTSATTSAAIVNALDGLPQVQRWYEEQLDQLCLDLNVPSPPQGEPLDLSPYGVLVFSSQTLSQSAHPAHLFPSHFHFVGPALQVKRPPINFPWDSLNNTLPKIFFSLGTVNAQRGGRLYEVVVEALKDEPVQVIASAPPELFPQLPSNFIVQPQVPQLELLPHMDMVIGHGGHNTTCETLAHGLPLLILPIKDDQTIIAEQIKRAGAGLRLSFARTKADKLRKYVYQLLTEDSFKESAQRIQREFSIEDGAIQAAQHVEDLIDKSTQKRA